jgi:probable O-glycosylation ligase (exosortase A-associated)
MRPYVGVLMFLWLSFMNPHRLTWGIAYDMPFAQIVAAVTLGAMLFSKEKKSPPRRWIVGVWVAFALWMCVTTMFALSPTDAFAEWTRTAKIQVIAFVTLMLIRTRQQLMALVWVVTFSLGFFGFKGGLFTVLTGGNYMVWGPPGSFFEGNNEMALALIMILPLIWFLRGNTRNRWIRLLLVITLPLTAAAILGSHSRGALVAGCAMGLALLVRSRHKAVLGLGLVAAVIAVLAFMPAHWFSRMETIKTYDEDPSAVGRINAWWFAFHLANDRPLVGGGFQAFQPWLFQEYAPDPEDFHDSHSIYFEVLGEHGYVGLSLFLALVCLAFLDVRYVMKKTKGIEDLRWAGELAAMTQVGLVGYLVGGGFLGLAYFDLYYSLLGVIVITRSIVERELEAPKASGTAPPAAAMNERPAEETAGSAARHRPAPWKAVIEPGTLPLRPTNATSNGSNTGEGGSGRSWKACIAHP